RSDPDGKLRYGEELTGSGAPVDGELGFGQLLSEGLAGDAEDLGGLALVALHLLHDLEDVRTLDGGKGAGRRRRILGRPTLGQLGELRRQVTGVDRFADRQD